VEEDKSQEETISLAVVVLVDFVPLLERLAEEALLNPLSPLPRKATP
jgi:hypothetical protein